jgi:hypothetical protein
MHAPQRLAYLIALAATVAVAACDRSPTASQRQPNGPRMATNTSVVCTGSSVPSGYVVLSYITYYTCAYGYGYPNAMTIGLPGASENVCESSPIPSGYVITSMAHISSCDQYSATSASYKNLYSIKIPTATYENVCSNSPIPSNYTTTSYKYFTSSCDQYGNGSPSWPNAQQIRHL